MVFPAPARRRPILVVDPDDDTRALYRATLERHRCEVVEASDGRDALTHALMRTPALVITELTLRFIDGYALCQLLRRDLATADVPIVVVTTETRPTQLDRVRTAGADSVLVKPILIEDVVTAIRRLVGNDARSQAAAASANIAFQRDESAHAVTSSEPRRRTVLAKSFVRFDTTTPPAPPPRFVCPSCDRPLIYEKSHIGGVSERQREQWDDYTCPSCGTFQYRHRTRRLSHAS